MPNPISRPGAVNVQGPPTPMPKENANTRSPRDRVIPNTKWPPRTTDPSGQMRAPATVTAAQASKPSVTQAPTIAEDAVIPIVYGGPERLAGMPYTVGTGAAGTALVVSYILCEGEVQSVGNIQINDAAPPPGCTFTVYTGTQTQGVDSILANTIPGFAETLAGTCYVVGTFLAGVVKTWPKLTAEVVGLRIPDSRAGNALGGWDNPALILAHFMRTYARRTVNAASVNAAATWCDQLLNGTRRAALVLTLKDEKDAEDWVEVLRGYLPAWVVERDGEWHILPDKDSAPVADYNADTDARTDGGAPMVLFKRGARDAPNVVDVQWTDASVTPWTSRKATATLPGIGTGQRRKALVALPGIRSYAQAYRFAVERLNHYTLEAIEGELSVFDEGIALVPGDIVTITDSAHGWDTKAVRLLRVDESDNGRWDLRFREYNPGAYSSNAPVAPPPPNSGTLPNPRTIAAPTGLAASEKLSFENASIGNDGLGRGLIWQSRVEATWTASPDPYFDLYEISLQGSTLSQPTVYTSRLAQFSSAPLVQGSTYTLAVRCINSLGFASDWASVAVAIVGKTAPPSDVTILDFAAEIGGECIFRWRSVPEPDVVRYEWRALATSAASAAWDSMTVIDRPDTNYTRIKGIAPGATLFAIKAVDSVGRYSVNPLFVNLTVTSDASAFLIQNDFYPSDPGGLSNVVRQDFNVPENAPRPRPRYISKGATAWNSAMANPVGSANSPVVNAWGLAGRSYFNTPTFDFGLVLDTTLSLNCAGITVTKGACTLYVATSSDGSTWDTTTNAIPLALGAQGYKSVKVTARFIYLQLNAPDANSAFMLEGPINCQISSTARKESGAGTTLASGPCRVNLAQKYTKAVSITITPKGTTFASPSYDNVIVGLSTTPNSFDVYIFNSSAQQIARDFAWAWAGV